MLSGLGSDRQWATARRAATSFLFLSAPNHVAGGLGVINLWIEPVLAMALASVSSKLDSFSYALCPAHTHCPHWDLFFDSRTAVLFLTRRWLVLWQNLAGLPDPAPLGSIVRIAAPAVQGASLCPYYAHAPHTKLICTQMGCLASSTPPQRVVVHGGPPLPPPLLHPRNHIRQHPLTALARDQVVPPRGVHGKRHIL